MSNLSRPLLQILRKLKLEWELDSEKLAQIAHVDPSTLDHYFSLSSAEMEALPTVPAGLESAVALGAIYQKLSRQYPEASKQNEWLVTPTELLENHKPIEVMGMSADHLSWVSYVLNSLN